MALGTRVLGAGKLLVLCGALLGTYLLFAAISMRLALRSREVEVPNFTNKTANEAMAMATDLGIGLQVDDVRRIDATIAEGHVLAQDPAPGTRTRQQRTLRVWLSAGTRAAKIPALKGETERTAELRLSQDGLELASVSEIRTDAFPADVVVSQTPSPETPGTRVALLVNRAEQTANFVMPDIIGTSGERAAAILRTQGFRVAVVNTTPYPGIPPGIVIRQTPQSGFQMAPSDAISIEVSR
ncbi:MAG: PASTA domain-containing protein [Acidobacteriaceae bacterium]|jgi:serine/threonine-protein kinase|nr:PASTA domain-containing protein [Acidobacteriaceae bacterium]